MLELDSYIYMVRVRQTEIIYEHIRSKLLLAGPSYAKEENCLWKNQDYHLKKKKEQKNSLRKNSRRFLNATNYQSNERWKKPEIPGRSKKLILVRQARQSKQIQIVSTAPETAADIA